MQKQDKYIVKLILGDDSGDGHGKYEIHKFHSNYPAGEIWDGYKKSCKKTGIQFNHNDNYTDIPKLSNWRKIFTKYCENFIKPEAIEILNENGIDVAQYAWDTDDEGNMYFDSEQVCTIIMLFIKLSMPDDWEYQEIVENTMEETINQNQFGYGLFD